MGKGSCQCKHCGWSTLSGGECRAGVCAAQKGRLGPVKGQLGLVCV